MKRVWIGFGLIVVLSFAVLGWVGTKIYQEAPPIPDQVVSTSGRVIFDKGDVSSGTDVWRGLGGMELGSIWGHGAYVAPDWTADWLHRELMLRLDAWSLRDRGLLYAAMPPEAQAALRQRLTAEYRGTGYEACCNRIVVSDERAEAIEQLIAYYTDLFRDGKTAYALQKGAVTDPARARKLAAFFFWSAWAAATNRPDDTTTYTSNWPHEPLIDNTPTSDSIIWTGLSILMLLLGIGIMCFWYATGRGEEPAPEPPAEDPLRGIVPTLSQLATIKYFWIVSALVLAQLIMGVITAHYGVEGGSFFGLPIADYLPYSVARTWHIQLGIFWIATAWLASGLAIGPLVGCEPKGQRILVNVLFGALLLVVVGSLAGQLIAVNGGMTDAQVWWIGHSGYEYIDLGRVFQIALMGGLFLWVFLVARSLWPALKRKDASRPLIVMLLISSIAIGGFYMAALGAGRHTNLAVAEYWRWWVVHLWVEGFFEVFATVIIAFLFAKLGLVRPGMASKATVLAGTIFLGGGVIGTLHHLYFSGTPTIALALGSVFSALEVVPLLFLGYDAWENWKHTKSTPWMQSYKWPIYFFIAVAFWNLVGAGLFGFMINPPVALYYMQGLNTTPVHGHTALFGVYGILGMGLMLFTIRVIKPTAAIPNRLLSVAFWGINVGLGAMTIISLLPVGIIQTAASIDVGYWYARSEELMQTSTMQTLRWTRVFGDSLFTIGALAFVTAVFRLTVRFPRRGSASLDRDEHPIPPARMHG